MVIDGTNFVVGNTVKIEGVKVEVEVTPTKITTEEIKPIKFNPVITNGNSTNKEFSGNYLVVNVGGINYNLALLQTKNIP